MDVFWEVFWEGIGAMDEYTTKTWGTYTGLDEYPIGSMYAIYGNMHLINIPPVMLAYIPAPWILWVCSLLIF